jgi:hypothetical protein
MLNKQQLNYNNKELLETVFHTQSMQRGYITKTPAELQLVESQAVRGKL